MENKISRSLIVILLLLSACLSGCSKKEVASPEAKRPSESIPAEELLQIKQEVYSFRVEGFGKDRKIEWNLEGESANVVLNEIKINNLKAVFYDKGVTFTLLADRAVYNKKNQDIELEDNIIGTTSDGGELVTDYAKWNSETEEITTDSEVLIKRQNITCKGEGAITKPRLKWVTFQREVEVNIAPDKKIVCSGPFEIDLEKNVAIFNNNVKITDKDSDTFTDRLTVFLNPETNEVARIITEGNVRVEHRGRIEDIGKTSF
ncbi:MAG: LPS export ABC transporter periplasmic protein LptC [Candidatus Omnitrophica bacterium]|nr:LPS export ABC transporter periplasmic protein LptC [Candidatus Omnitrophota bacterium]